MWYKDKTIVVSDAGHEMSRTGRLRILDVGKEAEGGYSCHASNELGSAITTDVHLKMAGQYFIWSVRLHTANERSKLNT